MAIEMFGFLAKSNTRKLQHVTNVIYVVSLGSFKSCKNWICVNICHNEVEVDIQIISKRHVLRFIVQIYIKHHVKILETSKHEVTNAIIFKLHVTIRKTCPMPCFHPRKLKHVMFDIFLDRRNIMYTDQRISDNMQFYAVS